MAPYGTHVAWQDSASAFVLAPREGVQLVTLDAQPVTLDEFGGEEAVSLQSYYDGYFVSVGTREGSLYQLAVALYSSGNGSASAREWMRSAGSENQPVWASDFIRSCFGPTTALAGRKVYLLGLPGYQTGQWGNYDDGAPPLSDSVSVEKARLVADWIFADREVWIPIEAASGYGKMGGGTCPTAPEPLYTTYVEQELGGVDGLALIAGTYFLAATPRGLLRTERRFFVDADDPLQPETSALRIAPNPASGRTIITLPTGVTQADVFDLTGRRVATLQVQGEAAEWDTSPHAPGLYLIRVVTRANVVSQVVVVAR